MMRFLLIILFFVSFPIVVIAEENRAAPSQGSHEDSIREAYVIRYMALSDEIRTLSEEIKNSQSILQDLGSIRNKQEDLKTAYDEQFKFIMQSIEKISNLFKIYNGKTVSSKDWEKFKNTVGGSRLALNIRFSSGSIFFATPTYFSSEFDASLDEIEKNYFEELKHTYDDPVFKNAEESCGKFIKFYNDTSQKFLNDDTLVLPVDDRLFRACEKDVMKLNEDMPRQRQEFIKVVDNFSSSIDQREIDLKSKIEKMNSDLNQKKIEIGKISESSKTDILASRGLVIDDSAIYVIFFTLLAWTIIIFIIVGSIKSIIQTSNSNRTELKSEFSYNILLEMMTVFLLTGTILVLGIAGKLNEEGLAALIGGISGYVLGRMHAGKNATPSLGKGTDPVRTGS